MTEAVGHLQWAVEQHPLDSEAARNLYQALGQAGDRRGQRRLARERWLLARMVAVEAGVGRIGNPSYEVEPWFAEAPPAGDELASIIVVCDGDGEMTRRCLESVKRHTRWGMKLSWWGLFPPLVGLVGEIIVVDTGSSDRTKEIAHEAGARVFDFPWVDSFAAARNESIEHATGEWIFWMDADDRLDEENRQKLRRLFDGLPTQARRASEGTPSTPPLASASGLCANAPLASASGLCGNPLGNNVAYVMKCLCLPDHKTGTATVVDHVRLFRNDPGIRWKYRVPEQILSAVRRAGGVSRWSDVVVHHTGYQDPDRIAPKLERDVRLLQMDLADNPEDPFTLFNLGWSLLKLGRPAEGMQHLEGSLKRSQPGDSIVRKAFALLIECCQRLGDEERALETCRRGRRLCPDDAEILFDCGGLVPRRQG